MSNSSPSTAVASQPRRRGSTMPNRKKRSSIPVGRDHSPWPLIFRTLAALFLTAGLLVFLALMRIEFAPSSPTLSIRSLDRINPVSLPAPPPPAEAETPPPPPPPSTELPKLDLQLDPVAPPVKAQIDKKVELDLTPSEFAPQNEQPRQAMTFALADLDSQPRLVNTPSTTFPSAMKSRGITKGHVTLDVHISSAGRVAVERVISSSHEEFIEMARSFAARARFTPPKKDGRPVNANFQWPLVLTP